MKTIYVVGDSTLADFKGKDKTYFYPRYGYGVFLKDYFNNAIKIVNLAMSGRSSKSFILENNYQVLKYNLKKGDYVIIGFGHNDEKADDSLRFTSANLDVNNSLSFKYHIYNYYAKLALDLGATPIICTPVSRLSREGNYSGNIIHETENGNYKNAILNLAYEFNLYAINLTDPTIEYNERHKDAYLTHAITNARLVDGKLIPDKSSVDNTHLNMFGAKLVAYYLCKQLKNTDLELKNFLIEDFKMPTLADLEINPSFKYIEYKIPNLDSFDKVNDFYYSYLGTIEKEDYIHEYKDNKYTLGTKLNEGKLNTSFDYLGILFKRLDYNQNFKFIAHAKVLNTKSLKQSGFGIQVRDDMYLTNSIYQSNSNNISCGMITTEKDSFLITSRETTTEVKRYIQVPLYKENDEIDLSILRIGQKIEINIIYNSKPYSKNFFDFDLVSKDNKYIYVGMFVSRATIVEFSDVSLELLKNSMEA